MEDRTSEQTARDSRLLNQLCCDVGFSQEEWERRLYHSDINNTCVTYKGLAHETMKYKSLFCGSRSEGVAMDFLGSDTDMLLILEGTRVVECDPVSPHDTDHTFKIIHTGHPAYVQLQFMSAANHGTEQHLETPRYCDVDESGRVLLNGGGIKERMHSKHSRHVQGPAVKSVYNASAFDSVFGLKCNSWPSSSAEWRNRRRPYNWPTPDVINEICSHGCELVAVGNPASATRHLEWRLSSSLAEKILIRSFNIFQIRCYFLLKLVLTFLIKPKVPHTLSSYHMKTVMLHVVETTDPAMWTETNLTRCFMKCLERLHSFVVDGNCPQYFISGHNLFEHRVQGESRARVLEVLEELLAQGWKCVLLCPPFNNGNLSCGHTYPRCSCYINHWRKHGALGRIKRNYECINYAYCVTNRALDKHTRNLTRSIASILATQRQLAEHDRLSAPNRDAATVMKMLFRGQMGYKLLEATKAVHAKNQALLGPILGMAKTFLEESCDVDIASGRLKLATFLYQTGQKQECVYAVHQFMARITANTVTLCTDFSRVRTLKSKDYLRKSNAMFETIGLDLKTMLTHVAYPMALPVTDMSCVPAGIKYVADNRAFLTEHDHNNKHVVFVDPLIHALYLLIICHKDLGRLGKSRRCLELMSRVIRSPHLCCVFYPEVANLLLEYCVRYITA